MSGHIHRSTFGVMPSKDIFEEHFNKVCENDGVFEIRNCQRVGDWDASCDELFEEIRIAKDEWFDGDPESLEGRQAEENGPGWASCVMYVLGFEWI